MSVGYAGPGKVYGSKHINTVYETKLMADHYLERAKRNEVGCHLDLLTARLYTAFFFEGAVNHIGNLLIPGWRTEKNTGVHRESLKIRYKAVRTAIGLNNDDQDYRDIASEISKAMSFRTAIAHPDFSKHSINGELVDSATLGLPLVSWEKDISLEEIQREYDFFLEHCEMLVHKTIAKIKSESEEDKHAFAKDHPKIGYKINPTTTDLKLLLYSTGVTSLEFKKLDNG